jgi:hypothetical protein
METKKPSKPIAPLPAKKTKLKPDPVQTYGMPQEVSDWIERANSIINSLRNQVAELKQENADLKSYRKFAEKRILRSEQE